MLSYPLSSFCLPCFVMTRSCNVCLDLYVVIVRQDSGGDSSEEDIIGA